MSRKNPRSNNKSNAKSSQPSRPQAPPRFQRPVRSAGRSAGSSAGSSGGAQKHSKEEVPRSWRIVAGQHAIDELVKIHGRAIKKMWFRQGWDSSNELRDLNNLCQKLRIEVEVKPPATLDKFCATHQGALAFIEGRPALDTEALADLEESTLLILDGLEDPHNLGAILRTSWLVGCQGVFSPEDRAVGLTPTVHKVACGGVEHVPVVEVTNFASPIESLKEQGYWVFGLSPRGTKSIFDLKIPEKVIWAIGSEDKGLRVTTEKLCDELVFIPQQSEAASYNASVATAMALTETLRQRMNSKKV